MIDLMFRFGTDVIMVSINKKIVLFGNMAYGNFLIPFEKFQLNKQGVIKEFPYLADEKEWRIKAKENFYAIIDKLGNEEAIADYLIKDLEDDGYTLIDKRIK